MTLRGREPETVIDALRSLSDWLDETDCSAALAAGSVRRHVRKLHGGQAT